MSDFVDKIEEKEDNCSTCQFVKSKIADEEKIYDLAELFKVFGDSTRTKILCCLEVKDL